MGDGVLVAAEGEAALVASDDAGRDPEAEAGAIEVLGGVEGLEEAGLPGRGKPGAEAGAIEVLGGVEGLEEAGLHGMGHAVASVGDRDAYARTALRIFGGI